MLEGELQGLSVIFKKNRDKDVLGDERNGWGMVIFPLIVVVLIFMLLTNTV